MQEDDERNSAHTWGVTMMGQDEEQLHPSEEEESQDAEEMDIPLEDDGAPNNAPTPTPRIVEGTLVESTLAGPSLPASPQAEDAPSRLQALGRWGRQCSLMVLTALLTVHLLVPTLAPVMRLFVSLVSAAGPSATVTLVTEQVDLRRIYTLLAAPTDFAAPVPQQQAQVEARMLTALALSQAVTIPTTGRGHQPAMQGRGTVTFYNQAPKAQTIPAGLLLSGADGVQVVTETLAVVPAAHLPTQGQATVVAHAVQVGPGGNIGANDLDGPCCFVGIAVQNAQAFTGGQNARDFPAVGAHDVTGAATPLTAALISQGQAAVQAQVHTHEQLVHPVQCFPRINANPAVGQEATQVTVRVSASCTAEAYSADQVQSRVTALLRQEATTHLGRAYKVQGEVTWTLSAVSVVNARRGIVNLHVQLGGLWAYQLSPAQLHALITLVAGKHTQEARIVLLRMQGIRQVNITSSDWWDDISQQTLPHDPGRIRVVVISWAGV
jgi:hypothetical protein